VSERLLRAWEVAERLGMSTAWVLDKWEAGELPGVRLGRRPGAPVRFYWSQIEAWLERNSREPGQPGQLRIAR
jgi:excisionase family DNA binding protein